MGLKDAKPAFEQDDEHQEDAATTNTTSVAASPARTAVSTSTSSGFKAILTEKENLFPVEAIVGLSMNVPRIKAQQGGAYVENASLGSKFRIAIESWNTRQLISAGLDQKDPGYKESVEFLRNSYDGETVHGEGSTIPEYLNYLKGMGYDKARTSSYIDIWGLVTWTEKDGDIPPEKQQLYLVQASQTSAGAFTAFRVQQGLKKDCAFNGVVELHVEARSKGNLMYSNFSFHLPSQ